MTDGFKQRALVVLLPTLRCDVLAHTVAVSASRRSEMDPHLSLPLAHRHRMGPAEQAKLVAHGLDERLGDLVALAAAHVLYLLDYVLPIDLIVDPLARGDAAEQRCLL